MSQEVTQPVFYRPMLRPRAEASNEMLQPLRFLTVLAGRVLVVFPQVRGCSLCQHCERESS